MAKINPGLIVLGISALVILIGVAMSSRGLTGDGSSTSPQDPLKKVTCDITVRNPIAKDLELSTISCTREDKGCVSIFPFSLFDTGDLKLRMDDGASRSAPVKVGEPLIGGKQETFRLQVCSRSTTGTVEITKDNRILDSRPISL